LYKIPEVTHISVDKVYARSKGQKGETRNDRFFTIITDMKSRKVIWVSDSRRKEGLDAFYKKIGPKACSKIQVVAQDQHEDYRSSTMEHCKNATIVYDKFHVIKSFNKALDEARKFIIKICDIPKRRAKKLRGKFKYILTMKDSKRTKEDRQTLKEAIEENRLFLNLELIKEALIEVFSQPSVKEAGVPPLKTWFDHLNSRWQHVAAYYTAPTTSALSEGINNVIKMIKRRAFGYRNMNYFKLKIMQVCGYLRSRILENQASGT
jgi:transposase